MQTKSYTSLIDGVSALVGSDLQTVELARLKSLVNRRAKKAYRATNYWPRFLVVGEARTVTDDNLVAYSQASLQAIDTFIRLHQVQPLNLASSPEFEFYVTADGARIISVELSDDDAPVAYATFKAQMSGSYGDATGETNTIPDEWFEYLVQGSYADWLRSDGQTEKAFAEDSAAREILMDELEKIESQHISQSVGRRVFTHGNMSPR